LAIAAKRCCSALDVFIDDVSKASSGLSRSFFSGQRILRNSDLKRLIHHDHQVITMVTKATNIANAAEREYAHQGPSDEVESLILRCQQMVTSSAGLFSERTMILDGLRQKKRRK
jgi:hypothetical protein